MTNAIAVDFLTRAESEVLGLFLTFFGKVRAAFLAGELLYDLKMNENGVYHYLCDHFYVGPQSK